MHLNWNPLGFLSELSQQKSVARFPPDVWQAFFCRSFRAPIPQMLAHAHSRTLCSCKMCIDPLGDHVLTCSTQVLFAVTIVSWMWAAKTEESGSAGLAGKRCAHCNDNISTDRFIPKKKVKSRNRISKFDLLRVSTPFDLTRVSTPKKNWKTSLNQN